MAKFNIKKLNLPGLAISTLGNVGGGYAAIKANKIAKIKEMVPWKRGLIKLGVGAVVKAFAPQYVKDKNILGGVEGFGEGLCTIGGLEIASKFDTSIPAIEGNGDVLGQVYFDERYTSPMSGTDVMGATDQGSGGVVVNL